ncbi:MAG: transcriptional repressor [Gammaproteobacteria bacterium]|jgi:Fur family iron response transcriptional regulator
MKSSQWQLDVQRAGRDAELRLAHPSGLCRQWTGDVACRLCQRLGLDTGRYPCPKSSAWRLFLLAHDLESDAPPAAGSAPPAQAPATVAPASPAPRSDWDARLREHGLRPTPARRAVAEQLLGRPRHVTAESLTAELARAGRKYTLNTVNRTLREFAEWDLLQVLDLGGGTVFYDTVTTPHPHLYNVDTGELSDLSPEQAWITGLPELPSGLRLDAVQLVFRVRGQGG